MSSLCEWHCSLNQETPLLEGQHIKIHCKRGRDSQAEKMFGFLKRAQALWQVWGEGQEQEKGGEERLQEGSGSSKRVLHAGLHLWTMATELDFWVP